MIEFTLYALVGALSGVMAGLFGIGGGLVIVPVLLLAFELKGFDAEVFAHMAVATSLAAIILNGLSAAWSQHKRRAVAWSRWALVPALVIGSLLGAGFAGIASGVSMRMMLAVFLLAMGLYMLRGEKGGENVQQLAAGWIAHLAGLGIGCVSALVGVAGGTFLVPLLTALGHPMRVAVGTSSALGVPLVSVAALGYMVVGFGAPGLPDWTIGYVYLPAFLGIALVSPWGAKLGVRLAHSLDHVILQRLFGFFLLANACWVLGNLWNT